MGKPTKNDTGSGGDERDERKNKAGSKRLGDIESSRLKTGVRTSARQSVAGSRGLKQPTNVTVHSPIKVGPGLGQAANRAINTAKPTISSSNKEVKKPSEAGGKTKSQSAKMKQETESSDSKTTDESTSSEALKQQAKDYCNIDEQLTGQQANGMNGNKHHWPVDKNGTENGVNKESEGSNKQNGGGASSERDEEFKLLLDGDDQQSNSKANNDDDGVSKEPSETNKDDDSQSDVKTSTSEAMDEPQTDTDSCSVDVVESTTSELSEATGSTTLSEIKDGESQNANDVVLDTARQECTVQLTDVLKDPQDESEVAHSDAETLSKPKRSNLKDIRARRSLRPGLSSQPLTFFGNISTDEGGASNVSDHYQSLPSESPATSTNGSTTSYELRKANLLRRSNDIAPTEEKKLKVVEDKGRFMQKIHESSKQKIEMKKPDTPSVTLGRWCSIM